MSACLSNSTTSSTAQAMESGHVHAGNLGKQLAKERIGLRQVVRRHFARERLARRRVDPRGEQAIGQRLREHVGKLLFVEVGDERFAEGSKPVVQPALFLLVLERADDQIADDARHARHALGKLLGGGDGQGRLLEKRGEQLPQVSARPRAAGLSLPLASSSASRTVSRFSPPTNQRNSK